MKYPKQTIHTQTEDRQIKYQRDLKGSVIETLGRILSRAMQPAKNSLRHKHTFTAPWPGWPPAPWDVSLWASITRPKVTPQHLPTLFLGISISQVICLNVFMFTFIWSKCKCISMPIIPKRTGLFFVTCKQSGVANKTNKQTKQMAKKKSCAIAPVHDADMAWYCLSRV